MVLFKKQTGHPDLHYHISAASVDVVSHWSRSFAGEVAWSFLKHKGHTAAEACIRSSF